MSAESPSFDTLLRIGSEWVSGEDGSLPIIDPGNGAILGDVALASDAQLDAAVAAASASFESWAGTIAADRGIILKRAADLLAERFEEAAATILLETGKTAGDARGEIQRSIDTLRWNGEEAGRIQGRSFAGIAAGSRRYSTPVPLGVVAAITAWNFPAVLATRKLGAALAAGCTVVLKAAEYAPATTRIIVQALLDAGLPDGAVNLVFGEPARVSERLLSNPAIKAVTFTGSTAVGKKLAALAAPNLTRQVFELGGHAPVIVWDDADVEHVLAVTAAAKFGSAGQSCVAPSRYYVHESRYDAFVTELSRRAKSLVLGHGNDPTTTLGAVAHQGRVDALLELVRDAVGRGARVVTGGHQVDRPGYYLEPTVLADVPDDARVLLEEPFGPIAAVVKVSDIDDTIRRANQNPYSFAAYLFTDSLSIRNAVTSRLHASNIGVNQTAPSLPDVPLGGLGNSGLGYEGGSDGILAFTQARLVSETA